MPEFSWRAVNLAGETISGQTTALNQPQLLIQLKAQKLVPVEISLGALSSRASASSSQPAQHLDGKKPASGAGKVQPADIFLFTSELAIMLRSGLALDSALRLLADMTTKVAMVRLIASITGDVKNGAPLSKALAAHPQHFEDFYISMIRSGEVSGQLAAVLERLIEHMERLRTLRDSVVSASIYPAILLFVALLSLVAMLGFVVPQFQDLFDDLGDALPLPTQVVVAMGTLLTEHAVLLLAGTAAGVVLLNSWVRSPAGRKQWHRLQLRLPVIGRIALKFQLTLFARTLGTLIGNGVPLLAAIQIATDTVGNLVVRQALSGVPAKIKSGNRVAQAFDAVQAFDSLAINLVKVGEETGRMGPMLLELADIYNRDVENGIKRGLTLLEPLLILVLGGLIAAIIVSILLGILSVNDLAL